MASLSSALSVRPSNILELSTNDEHSAHITPNTTATAHFENISAPPKSLIPEILSVVPITVIWELIDPQSRSILASQFSAGTTPAWYNSLPTDVKSYMSVVKSQISAGALTATTTGTSSAAKAGATSTSSGMAAQPTALTASVMGALSVLGLALAL
jgi:hypothetical protein